MLPNNQNNQPDDTDILSQPFEDIFDYKENIEQEGGKLISDLDNVLDSLEKKAPIDKQTIRSIEGNIESPEELLHNLKKDIKKLK